MSSIQYLHSKIRDVPDFPKPGIVFKDITPLLQDRDALRFACTRMAEPFKGLGIDVVIGIESRGFIFGPSVALELEAGFGIARKAGKLPWDTLSETYDLEYGTATIEMHRDTVGPGQKILLIDDVIATGGTAAATAKLATRMGAEVLGASFLVELGFLNGKNRLDNMRVEAVLEF